MFPVVLDDLVAQEHLVRVIDAFVARLDLVQLGFAKSAPAATGRPAFDPGDLLRLYLYGYLNQMRSSRKLERECARNLELMWLVNGLKPDHKTIAEFRRCNAQPFKAVCAVFVGFCRQANLLGCEAVAIDGSKFQAVASKRKAVTEAQLQRQEARLQEQIEAYLQALAQADDAEQSGEPDTQALRAALTQLTGRLADVQCNRACLQALGQSQHVVGEPEARLMKTGQGTAQVAYNVQSAVDARHALIVAHKVTDEAADRRQLLPMSQAAIQALGVARLQVLADAGYANGEQINQCEALGITAYVPLQRSVNNQGGGAFFDKSAFVFDAPTNTYRCPAGQTLTQKQRYAPERQIRYSTAACGMCALKPRCTAGRARIVSRHFEEDALARLEARMRACPQAMRLRRQTVEHPFGNLKGHILGNGRLLMRGLRGAAGEIALAVLAYNFRRVLSLLGEGGFRHQISQARVH